MSESDSNSWLLLSSELPAAAISAHARFSGLESAPKSGDAHSPSSEEQICVYWSPATYARNCIKRNIWIWTQEYKQWCWCYCPSDSEQKPCWIGKMENLNESNLHLVWHLLRISKIHWQRTFLFVSIFLDGANLQLHYRICTFHVLFIRKPNNPIHKTQKDRQQCKYII